MELKTSKSCFDRKNLHFKNCHIRHCGRTASVLKESVIGTDVSLSTFKTSGAIQMPLYYQEILRCYCSNPYERISDTKNPHYFDTLATVSKVAVFWSNSKKTNFLPENNSQNQSVFFLFYVWNHQV